MMKMMIYINNAGDNDNETIGNEKPEPSLNVWMNW